MLIRRLAAPAFSKITLLLAFLLVAVCVARAQVSTGTIVGTVQDKSGGVVPNATVTITHIATGQTRVAHTDGQGSFNAQFMPLGTQQGSL